MTVAYSDSMYKVQGRTKQVLRGPNSTEPSLTCSIMDKPHTGPDDCLNMLLSCFKQGCLVRIRAGDDKKRGGGGGKNKNSAIKEIRHKGREETQMKISPDFEAINIRPPPSQDRCLPYLSRREYKLAAHAEIPLGHTLLLYRADGMDGPQEMERN